MITSISFIIFNMRLDKYFTRKRRGVGGKPIYGWDDDVRMALQFGDGAVEEFGNIYRGEIKKENDPNMLIYKEISTVCELDAILFVPVRLGYGGGPSFPDAYKIMEIG